MLVISRRPGERLRIGPNVWVTVLSQQGSKIRLGIEAPADVEVMRQELIGRVVPAIPTAWGPVGGEGARGA